MKKHLQTDRTSSSLCSVRTTDDVFEKRYYRQFMGFIGSIGFIGSMGFIRPMFSFDSLSVSFSAFSNFGSLRIDSI